MPGKHLLTLALPKMTPGRPRGAGHPLDALGRPRWGQPPAVCSVCLPRLRGPEITGPLRCGGRRVPHRATLRKGRDPGPFRGRGAARPCAGRPGAATLALRRRTAPRSGARVGTPLAAPRAARHRWAGPFCRMTGLRQNGPAWFGVPATIRGHGRASPARGLGPFRRAAHFPGASVASPRTGQGSPGPQAGHCAARPPAPLAIPATSVAYRRGRRQRPRRVLRSH